MPSAFRSLIAVVVSWTGSCPTWSAEPVTLSVAELFAESDAPPLPADLAGLVPHQLVVQHALPIIAEQTWRIDHADLTAAAHATALAKRARARADLRQHTAAFEDLNTAIDLQPERAELYRQRAWLAGVLRQYERAEADLATAFRLEPRSSATARVLGLLRHEQGRFADAAAVLSFRLEVEPSDPPLTVLHAMARIRSTDAPGGRAELDELAELADYLERWPRGIALMMAGRMSRAEFLKFAGNDASADPAPVRACQAWFYLGQRGLVEGATTRAELDFRRAVRTGGTAAVEFRLAVAELQRAR
jgi:tetratricopeptide (TPR) repeat protein